MRHQLSHYRNSHAERSVSSGGLALGILGALLLAALAAVTISFLPDLYRYQKIRDM